MEVTWCSEAVAGAGDRLLWNKSVAFQEAPRGTMSDSTAHLGMAPAVHPQVHHCDPPLAEKTVELSVILFAHRMRTHYEGAM